MSILPSHKQGVVYIEHCRVIVADERLTYVRKDEALERHWSIPFGNINVLLLGPGTSITQQAARLLAGDGVMVGFTGGGGSPLFLSSHNEYRPTEYLQEWVGFWFDPQKRLKVAKTFQGVRCEMVKKGFYHLLQGNVVPDLAINEFHNGLEKCQDTNKLLGYEAVFAKNLYKLMADYCDLEGFTREPRSKDIVNRNLDQGNYLAYGLAASALWVMGIPHSLPVCHGKTRRGALVFDVADMVKDACILPNAFLSAKEDEDQSQFRKRCLKTMDELKVFTLMLEQIKLAPKAL